MANNEGDYLRNTSDDMFLGNLMVSGTPSMEASSLGFLDIPSNLQPVTIRGNSEELFQSWITNSNTDSSNQNQHGLYPSSSSTVTRPRQRSRRMSSELQGVVAQQNGSPWTSKAESGEQAHMETNSYLAEDLIATMNSNHKPHRINTSRDKRLPGPSDYSPLGPLNSMQDWFSASTPMTRSQSSELRRRYAQLQGLPFPASSDAFQKLATNRTIECSVNPAAAALGAFARGINSTGGSQDDQGSAPMVIQSPIGPTVSSPASVNQKQLNQQQQSIQQHGHSVLSNVVGLLKGSLERKKLQTKQEQEHNEQQQQPRSMHSPVSPPQENARQDELLDTSHDQIQGESGLVQVRQVQQRSPPQADSPSGSSEAAPSHSAGIAMSDGPSNSCMSDHKQAFKHGAVVDQPSPNLQALSCVDSPNAHSNGNIHEYGTPRTDMIKKSDHLARAGSITSSLRQSFQLNEIDGATKKRRVERQRKMAEAKGRGIAPPLPADLQAVIKRCEALEKEVRSLKLNLSFMNRKDSEQTKRIEELEQENEDLKEGKDRLLEELQCVSIMNEAK